MSFARTLGLVAVIVTSILVASDHAAGVQPPPTEQVRIQERLRALRQEADELAAREKSLLTDLRRAELERAHTAEPGKMPIRRSPQLPRTRRHDDASHRRRAAPQMRRRASRASWNSTSSGAAAVRLP